jgi:predicted membrane protein
MPACRSTQPAGQTLSESWFLWGLLFGSIGLGFFVYGSRQRAVVPLACGLALMIFPYFVSSTLLFVTLGIVLTAIPYFFRF